MTDPRTTVESTARSAHPPSATVDVTPDGAKTGSIGRRRSDRIVAASDNAQRSVDQATARARGSAPILIVGPSGSGRKHFARAIHSWSGRSNGPLIELSIDSDSEGQQERQLFGKADSAADSRSLFERATNGSVVLHRFDRLAASVRSVLAEAIRTGTARASGNSESIPIAARIIATSESAEETVLSSLPFEVVLLGSLSERREDVLPLAAHFLAEFADSEGVRPVGFTSDARNWLIEENFTGNVRELRERIREAVRLGSDGVVSAEALMLANDSDDVPSFKEAKRAFEARYVEGLLRRCRGNISRAARLAKKDRKDFYDVIRRTGVDPSEFRS